MPMSTVDNLSSLTNGSNDLQKVCVGLSQPLLSKVCLI